MQEAKGDYVKSRVDYADFEQTMKNMINKSMLRSADRSPSKSPQKRLDSSPSRSGSISPAKLTLRKRMQSPYDDSVSYQSPKPKKDSSNKVISPEKGNPFRNSDKFKL